MVRLTRCWHENFEIHDWANIVTQPTELLPLPAVLLICTVPPRSFQHTCGCRVRRHAYSAQTRCGCPCWKAW